jgi:3-mercaptopyruvate sulfurtransferase SseA
MPPDADLETHWQERAKGLIKGELKRRGVSYKQLAEKLYELGVHETDRNIANKLARGGFSAVFMIQCLEAIGCNSVQLRA